MNATLIMCYDLLIKNPQLIPDTEIIIIHDTMVAEPVRWFSYVDYWTSPATRHLKQHKPSVDSISANGVILLKIINSSSNQGKYIPKKK